MEIHGATEISVTSGAATARGLSVIQPRVQFSRRALSVASVSQATRVCWITTYYFGSIYCRRYGHILIYDNGSEMTAQQLQSLQDKLEAMIKSKYVTLVPWLVNKYPEPLGFVWEDALYQVLTS